MILAGLALALALQTASPATDPVAPTAPATAKATQAADPVECRSEAVTGTHLSSRTCLRRSEWARLHDQSVQALGLRGRDRQPGLHPN